MIRKPIRALKKTSFHCFNRNTHTGHAGADILSFDRELYYQRKEKTIITNEWKIMHRHNYRIFVSLFTHQILLIFLESSFLINFKYQIINIIWRIFKHQFSKTWNMNQLFGSQWLLVIKEKDQYMAVIKDDWGVVPGHQPGISFLCESPRNSWD